jgi:hypothetical protein
MSTIAITKKEIYEQAPKMDAVRFDAFCEKNGIESTWLDVTLTDYNQEYYNVDLPTLGLNVIYYDGVLEEIVEL